jgi:hypothetical protein
LVGALLCAADAIAAPPPASAAIPASAITVFLTFDFTLAPFVGVRSKRQAR